MIELMERGLVDFIISTGANLYHDLHYALNFTLHRGSPFLDDRVLYEQGVIRIYDVLFPAKVLLDTDAFIREFLIATELDGPVSTAEFHYDAGRASAPDAARLRGVFGRRERREVRRPDLHLVAGRQLDRHERRLSRADARRHADDQSRTRTSTRSARIILGGDKNGCVILGGGSPKNFYLQGQPTLWEVYGIPKGGNDYFIQITTDQVVWGGLVGGDAVRGGELGQGQSRRAARHRGRLRRLDHRVSALLRVRVRPQERPAQAQGAGAQARRRWSRRSRPKPIKARTPAPEKKARRTRKAVLTRVRTT